MGSSCRLAPPEHRLPALPRAAVPPGDEVADAQSAVAVWRESSEAALDDRVICVTYERLVGHTEEVMMRLAERIGISMSPVLLEPTFNGRPIRANSAEAVESYGIIARREPPPPDPEVAELAGDLYERAQTVSV